MAPKPPNQLTVIAVNEPTVCVRLKGTDGKVKTERLELAVEPLTFTAVTMTAYDVPANRPVKVADVEVLEAGTLVTPSIVYV